MAKNIILTDLVIDGTLQINNVVNSVGDFITIDTNKQINKRTNANVLLDIGAEPKFIKKNGFNRTFGTAALNVVEGNDSRVNNGQTAFGWGDHSVIGYALEPRTLLVSSTAISLSIDRSKTILFSSGNSGISVKLPDATIHLGKEVTLTTTTANPVQITSYDVGSPQMFYKNSTQSTRGGYYSVTVISNGTYWVITSFINI